MSKTEKLTLLIDMDGVCADILAEWLPKINADYNENLTKDNLDKWNIHECTKAGKKAFDYTYELGFFLKLKPMPHFVDTLRMLWDEGFNIFYVTAPDLNSATTYYEKIQWIKEYTPFMPLDHLIFAQRKDMIKGDILFDDAPKNLESFPGIPIAFDYKFNKHVKTRRVKNWLEFYDMVHEIQRERDLQSTYNELYGYDI